MKNIEITKRLLALISATTITLTMGGCGQSSEKNDSSNTTTSIILEVNNSSNTTSVITSSTENSSINTSSITSKEDKTETSSLVTSETSSKPTNSSKPSTSSTSQSSRPSSSNSSGTTTSSTSNTSSTESTTSKPNEQTVQKLTASNINDVSAIDAIANKAGKYLYNVEGPFLYLSIGYSYNGQTYYCDRDEFRMFISLLNIENINEETLKEMFSEMTSDDIIRCSRVFGAISDAICQKTVTINYNQFIVNDNTRLFLNELQTQVIKYKNQQNIDEYNQYVEDYFNGKNKYIKYGENIILDNYVYTLCGRTINLYDNIYLDFVVSTNTSASAKYNKYIKNEFYNKTRAKQLVKD